MLGELQNKSQVHRVSQLLSLKLLPCLWSFWALRAEKVLGPFVSFIFDSQNFPYIGFQFPASYNRKLRQTWYPKEFAMSSKEKERETSNISKIAEFWKLANLKKRGKYVTFIKWFKRACNWCVHLLLAFPCHPYLSCSLSGAL